MDKVSLTLTIYFDGQFYIGLFENIINKKLSVSKWVFGAEPKDQEVSDFICNCFKLLKFSPSVNLEKTEKKYNPKTMQRKVKKSLQSVSVGTKSQQAIKLQVEERKVVKKEISKLEKEKKEQELFELKQEKKKEKHKGH